MDSSLNIIKSFNPQLATLLQNFPPIPSIFPPFFEKENQELFCTLTFSDPEVLYVYGLGSGYFYYVAKEWLQQTPFRTLVFLEDDLEAIQLFLQTSQAKEILSDFHVDLYYIQNLPLDRKVISEIVTSYMLRKTSLGALEKVKELKKTQWFDLQEALSYESAEHNLRYRELSQYGLAYYSNFYHNLLQLPFAYLGNSLKDQFKDLPAIICGAGYSLNQQLPLLKELKKHALLIAPGSALNILSYQGLMPHFGVAVDPTPNSFHRQVMHRAFETPIFYRNRLYHETLTAIHGPRIFLSGSTFYLISEWFEKELKLETLYFEEGYSVVHQALEVARFLGCNPVIFVGLDLSQKEHHYAEGIESHPLFPPIENKLHLGSPIQVRNLKGEIVWSYWPWIAEAQWLEIYQFYHKEMTLINANEEGIGLFSIAHTTLAHLKKTLFKEKKNLIPSLHDLIQKGGKVPIKIEMIIEKICFFQASLKRCQQYLLDKNKEESFKQEIGYQFVLKQFEDFFEEFTSKDRQKIQRMQDEKRREESTLNLDRESDLFLLQTVCLQLKTIENALKTLPFSSIEKKIFPICQGCNPSYYASGALYSEQLNDGTERFYYESGQLKSEIPYEKDSLCGYVRLYYPNGQIKRELFFQKGKRQGTEKSWYENGQLFTEITVGHRARSWFEDGTLAQEIKK